MEGTVRIEGDVYRMSEVYSLPWSAQELEESVIALGPCGGPVALARDYRKLVLLHGPADHDVRTYTAAGDFLASFEAPKGRVLALGWTRDFRLAVVTDEGATYLYTMLGALQRQLPFRARGAGAVLDAACWGDGCGLLAREAAGGIRAHAVLDLCATPRAAALAPFAAAGPEWGVHAAAFRAANGAAEAFVALRDGAGRLSLHRAGPDAAADVTPAFGGPPAALAGLALSPSGGLLAALAAEPAAGGGPAPWRLRVARVAPDALQLVADVALPEAAGGRPRAAWCGGDAVAVAGDGALLLVAATGALARLELEPGPVWLAPEVDGVAVVSPDARAFLGRLPAASAAVGAPGSTAPGALLLDAAEAAEEEPQADGALRRLLEARELPAAVAALLEAALHEPAAAAQRRLLRAAALGDAYAGGGSAPAIAQACHALRLLNALRAEGIPTTYPQLRAVGAAGAVGHALARGQHLLAARLCAHVGLPPEGVLREWAAARAAAAPAAPDAALFAAIAEKVPAPAPPGLYAALAGGAVALGRPRLAGLLLEREGHAERHAAALLELQDDAAALQHAAAAHHLCLAEVLLRLQRRRPVAELLALLARGEAAAARALFAALVRRAGDGELLKTLAFHTGDREEAGLLTLREFLAGPAAAEAGPRAAVAARCADFFAGDPFAARVLAAEGARLKARGPPGPAGAGGGGRGSGAEAVQAALEAGDERGARRLAAALGLSEARAQRLRVRAACARRDWGALEAPALAKVSPEALVEAAVAGGALQEAARLIARIPDRETKVFFYLQINCLREAAELAAGARDAAALAAIRARATDPNLLLLIDRALQPP